MATHRAVAFVMQKENIEISIPRRSDDGAIHVSVAARFPHQAGANVIVMFAKVTSFFENGEPLDWWQSVDNHEEWLTASMHVNGSEFGPLRRWFPGGELSHQSLLALAEHQRDVQ